MDVDYRIKANSPSNRDGNVDAWKIPAAWDQSTVEERRILAVHFEQQLQLVLDGEFTSDLVGHARHLHRESGRSVMMVALPTQKIPGKRSV